MKTKKSTTKVFSAEAENQPLRLAAVISRFFSRLLKKVVDLQIKHGLFNNVDKFSVGDYVMYNWKAKAVIPQVVGWEPGIKKILKLKDYRDGTQGCDYENITKPELFSKESGCDVFWLRKASNREVSRNGL